ncbi:glycosyltransferase family 4 protein [Billgrantia sulfidoxydans]|uniref:Glycosyltransferase family 4 protein n=1 Tax=Billgrantia sulfidoxydans TaxID=2733484 RepID=A0ABX7VY56_9GAMM|nr:glycosyltransferase family 4 protein [Halomonas sulfidoxydans]QTP53346.1 glycosyltransferase family 4 protein [Halomonas sulfidoxydans]
MTETAGGAAQALPVVRRRVLVIGGTARSLSNFRGPLLKLLGERGHRIVAAAHPDASAEGVRRELAALSIPFEPLAIGRGGLDPLEDWRTARAIRALIARHAPEVLIAYTAKPVIYAGLAVRDQPGVRFHPMITGLGYAFSEARGAKRSLLHALLTRLYRRALANAHTTIFQNPDDQALFRECGLLSPTARSAVVDGSGVDVDLFPPRPLPREPVFLMLARLMVEKGVRVYVEAARLVHERYPQARFQLAGALDPNPSSVRPEELAAWQAAGDIEYLGKLESVQAALAGCRCYVLPSWYREGIPRSVLEAMATGRPIITTDSPGCRETVEPGINGWRVEPRSARALADAMLALIEADDTAVAAMARASLEQVERRYDVRRVNRQLLEITQL